MSLKPETRAEREATRRRQFDAIVPLTPELGQLSCLMCRRCQCVPETYADAELGYWEDERTVRIFCQKTGRLRPARLHRDCPIADPRPARPRHLHRLWANMKSNFGDLGDLATKSNDLLLLWIKHRWPHCTKAELEARSGRTSEVLKRIAADAGYAGQDIGITRNKWQGRPHYQRFSPEQTRYLQSIYGTSFWPRKMCGGMAVEARERELKKQERIIDECAHLHPSGPRWNWRQIGQHLCKRRKESS